ncbi:hypothetical protein HK107_09445 [Parvularcula sp. ZS-1/3]|uniref:Sugar transporter n=1 Tax=Parvularcula mediterranea TaxID=2732508 RepID=A0A7Y3RLZ4_9PROT|nr:hypothetical protein [Parvularcula mediterranea]NNU16543.1 hypothetical protein [Parvularcula mediterranea]
MKPGIAFWIVGILALLFNSYGVYDYIMTVSNTEAHLAAYPPEQVEYWLGMPAWRTGLWAIGVFSGVIASVLYLAKKSWAVPVFAIGPVVFLLNLVASLFDGGPSIMGAAYYIASLVILAIITFFWWFARRQRAAGVLS